MTPPLLLAVIGQEAARDRVADSEHLRVNAFNHLGPALNAARGGLQPDAVTCSDPQLSSGNRIYQDATMNGVLFTDLRQQGHDQRVGKGVEGLFEGDGVEGIPSLAIFNHLRVFPEWQRLVVIEWPVFHSDLLEFLAQTDMLIEAASGPWCIALFLEMAVGLGARRGEVLALRWSDLVDGRALIARSLTQTKYVLEFKCTKTDEPRVAKIPEETLPKLEVHRKRQDEFRLRFGPDYRNDIDLIFSYPDGSPLKPNSISATVSALFKRLKIPKPKGGALH